MRILALDNCIYTQREMCYMSKTYLFSPIGNTDPIKYFYDGSMLHICRYYKPDVVILYLSQEMILHHEKDNRYVRSIELLGEKLGHTFEVRIIRDEQMVDVQQYDLFYHAFRRIIADIEEEMTPEDTLIVNMASGTPAMKSALLVMATLAEYRFLPIQVSTPKRRSNLGREDYDVEKNWEMDTDNRPEMRKRCEEVRCVHLVQLLKMDMIKKHLQSYDYHAALQVGREIQRELDKEDYAWLETADARTVLDWERMNRFLPKNNGVLWPVKAEDQNRVLLEYTLSLDLKVKRGEYADFIRAITPLGVDLLERVIEQYCGIYIEAYYSSRDSQKWSRIKLADSEVLEILNRKFTDGFRFGPVYSYHLNTIVQAKCSDALMAQRVQELVNVEQKVRNLAAHSIVSATPEWVKERTGKSVDEIMWLIRYICEKIGIADSQESWRSYDRMNKKIIERLDKTQL